MKQYNKYKDSGVQWLDIIPNHWEVKRLANLGLFSKGSGISRNELTESGLPAILYGDIYTKYEISVSHLVNKISPNTASKSIQIHSGDILMTGSGETKEDIGKTVIYEGEDAYAGGDVIIFRQSKCNGMFLSYSLNSSYSKHYRAATSKGEIVVHTYPYILKNLYLPIPPIAEQEGIVAFLDEKTAAIDDLVEQVEREIELLKEFKQAEIARVVTKGLNPNAPMKPSGIAWIGDIPQHWSVRNLFQVATSYYESNKGMKNQNLLSLSYGAIILKDINKTDGLLPASFETYQIVQPNIIVLRLTDLQNDHKSLRVGISKYEGIVTSAYEALKVREPNNADYVYYQLHVNDIHKVFYGMGNGLRQNLNYDGMRYMKLVVPPAEEQQEIVDYIDRKTTEIDRLVVELTNQVEYLKEYKQRLIADVVTGKINVQPE